MGAVGMLVCFDVTEDRNDPLGHRSYQMGTRRSPYPASLWSSSPASAARLGSIASNSVTIAQVRRTTLVSPFVSSNSS